MMRAPALGRPGAVPGSAAAPRRANTLLVALVLSVIMLVGVSAFDFLTRTDVSTTANLIREIEATGLAESIAAQIEARVNRRPWEERFWLREAQARGTVTPGSGLAASTTFDPGSGHVRLEGEVLSRSECGFSGIVKDLDPALREYRVYVELSVHGVPFTFSWDKRYSESLLGGMNRETTQMAKSLDHMPTATNPADMVLDDIKARAGLTPVDLIEAQLRDVLESLRKDELAYEGTAGVAPEPTGTPETPPPPSPPDKLPAPP